MNRLAVPLRSYSQSICADRPGLAAIGTRVSAISCFEVSSNQTTGHSGSRPVVDVQHVFHVGDESGVDLRRDDILLLQMRFEIVFQPASDRVVAGALNGVQSTTVSSSNRKVHFARPFGGGEHIRASVSLGRAVEDDAWSAEFRTWGAGCLC